MIGSIEIHILSGLHLQSLQAYNFYDINPTVSYPTLLGDIGCVCDPEYLAFLTIQLERIHISLHVLENHEPYGCTRDSVVARLRAFQATRVSVVPPKGLALRRMGWSRLGQTGWWLREEWMSPRLSPSPKLP